MRGVTWWQVLAVAAGVDQDVGVEGGVEPLVSAADETSHARAHTDAHKVITERSTTVLINKF